MKAIFTIVAAVGVLAGFELQALAVLANGIKAVVHDSVITYEQVEELTEQTAGVVQRQSRNQEEFEKRMNEVRSDNLEKRLAEELILHEFKTAGYALPESIIDDMVQERIRSRFGDRRTLTKTLQAQGITFEKFRQQVREQFIIEAMRQKNISSEIIISPYKIERYFGAHRDEFKVEDEVKLRMIVLNKSADTNATQVQKLADDILSKLNEGVSFSELASIHSQGSQRSQGGDWGWVEKSVLRKELVDVAFSLKPDQHSGVIDTPEACYLMLVEDTRTSHWKPLADVREIIERNLKLEERNRLEKQWIDRLKKKTFVRYF